MISKESAKNISNEIMNREYASLREERRAAFIRRYGHFLGKKIAVEFRDEPEIIDKAIRYSHSRWQVILATFVWLGILFPLIYMFEETSTVVLLVVILGGGLGVGGLIKTT